MALGETRQEKILNLLEESREVYVSRLSKQLQVSEMTIRRDLKLLEQQGKLKRVYGGAVHASQQLAQSVDWREKRSSGEKQSIAAKASERIEPHMLVFIGGGSTTGAMAERMSTVPSARIVTHSIQIAHQLAMQKRADVYVLGGILRPDARTLIGPEMQEALKRYVFDLAITSVEAIDLQHGFLEPTEWHAYVCRLLRQHSRRVMVLADRTKFGSRSVLRALEYAEVDILVTDSPPPKEHQRVLKEAGVEVLWPEASELSA